MSDGHGEPNTHRKESVGGANVASDSPVTDPGQVRGVSTDTSACKFDGQRGKSGALKKSARYRSRSLSASSADSYSSTSYTDRPMGYRSFQPPWGQWEFDRY
ncbi:hypothetical protein KGM_212080 [Danaus plexippus plexippus]|uniref:Uncharacterized protein n=1 Tax=Danaus plexippus plexippus TaxID=278856 RepID=A0A212F7N5_DANPL|nr:hypothetical protein KGM_212080 [Danaus plexippus plexippus]